MNTCTRESILLLPMRLKPVVHAQIPSAQRGTHSIDELFWIPVSQLCPHCGDDVRSYRISFNLSVHLRCTQDQGMTVRFGMNSSSDAESSGKTVAKHESSSREAGLSWRMRLIAQAAAIRLAPTDGRRRKRHLRTL